MLPYSPEVPKLIAGKGPRSLRVSNDNKMSAFFAVRLSLEVLLKEIHTYYSHKYIKLCKCFGIYFPENFLNVTLRFSFTLLVFPELLERGLKRIIHNTFCQWKSIR